MGANKVQDNFEEEYSQPTTGRSISYNYNIHVLIGVFVSQSVEPMVVDSGLWMHCVGLSRQLLADKS